MLAILWCHFHFFRANIDFDILVMYSHTLCSPSSLDAIFLAHGLVVLQALPVSVAVKY
jgi:hypothetical protein